MSASNMKTIKLTAYEAATLRDTGALDLRFDEGTRQPQQGETVAILEPWALLLEPPGAYNTDLPPRYIYEADKTAEPVGFSYQAAETMPMEAVKRYAVVETVGHWWFLLRLIGEEPNGKYHII